MDYASIELSEELYKLSKWKTDQYWHQGLNDYQFVGAVLSTRDRLVVPLFPAYDASFLLRKLPKALDESDAISMEQLFLSYAISNSTWLCGYRHRGVFEEADTPENALAKLAIELFKQGILKKGIGDE